MNQGWFRPYEVILVFAALHASTWAVGSEAAPVGGRVASGAVFVDDPDLEDIDDSLVGSEKSATERITNSYSVELSGAWRKGAGYVLHLAKHLDEDRIVELKIGQFKASDRSSLDTLELQHYLLQSKYFLGNSLFMAVGAGWASIKAKNADSLVNSASGMTEHFNFTGKAEQVLLAISMGNQWQQGAFIYGVNWLDLYLPFQLSKVKTTYDEQVTNSEQRRLKNEGHLKTEAGDFDYGLSFSLGYAF